MLKIFDDIHINITLNYIRPNPEDQINRKPDDRIKPYDYISNQTNTNSV